MYLNSKLVAVAKYNKMKHNMFGEMGQVIQG